MLDARIKRKVTHNESGILVTGGTGSFGKAFIKRVLTDYPNISRLLYTAETNSSNGMQQIFPESEYPI